MLDDGDYVIVIKHDEFLADASRLRNNRLLVYRKHENQHSQGILRVEAYYVVLFININNFYILTPVVFSGVV